MLTKTNATILSNRIEFFKKAALFFCSQKYGNEVNFKFYYLKIMSPLYPCLKQSLGFVAIAVYLIDKIP